LDLIIDAELFLFLLITLVLKLIPFYLKESISTKID
jgi:hypothetical protein